MDRSSATRRWDELPPVMQRALMAVGAITTVWQIAMLVDLWRRPAEQIRGAKTWWVVASFARPVGQIAYYRWGRQPSDVD